MGEGYAEEIPNNNWRIELNKMEIRATSNVVREQIIEISLADMDIAPDVDRVKIVVGVAGNSYGRPHSRTIIVPDYMIEQMRTA